MQENRSSVPNQMIPQSQFQQPPPKSMRISDMYFPDPMFYPGYYPSGMMNPYDQLSQFNHQSPYQPSFPDYRNGMGNMFDRMAKMDRNKRFINNNLEKYERNRIDQLPKKSPNRFNALQNFVDTVHNIHSRGKGYSAQNPTSRGGYSDFVPGNHSSPRNY